MRNARRRFTTVVGDVCVVTMVLSAATCVGFWLLAQIINDVRLQGGIVASAGVFVVAAIVFHAAEGD